MIPSRNSNKKIYEKNRIWLCLICVSCLILMSGFPVPEGYDISQHLRFAATYKEAIEGGYFIPSWASVDNLGYGSIGIRFYPPLADFVLAVTQIFTKDWYISLLINSFFWMFPGCIGVYFWVKEFRTPIYAGIAGVLYAAIPYHLMQIYRMQLYSEFVAAAILPFCFLFATKLTKQGKAINILGLSLTCSLLLLTHIPSSLIGLSGLGLYAGFLIDWRNPLKSIGKFALAAIFTLISTSFYLVRLLTEVSWVKHSSTEFSTGFFDFRRHLFPLLYSFGEDYWKEEKLALLDQTIILTIVFFIPLIFCLVKLKNFDLESKFERKVLIAISVTGFYSVFILSIFSNFVWETFEVLQKIQFPWRFLLLVSLFAVVSMTFALSLILESKKVSRPMIYWTIACVFGILIFGATRTVWLPDRMLHKEFNQNVVKKREIIGCACWFPEWGKQGVFENQKKVRAGNRSIEITSWDNLNREFTVAEGEPQKLQVATFYYPYWKAKINGQKTEVLMDENGAILIDIPDEKSEIQIYFEEPFMINFSLRISLISWLLLMIGLAVFYWKEKMLQKTID